MAITILVGDVREHLKHLEDDSVHCIVTSPPYLCQRDYRTGIWVGGDPECSHRPDTFSPDPISAHGATANGKPSARDAALYRGTCSCGAVRQDQQIGLEATPAEYIATMVEVFEQLRRVLRSDGTCWLNMGDGYAGSRGSGAPSNSSTLAGNAHKGGGPKLRAMVESRRPDDTQVPRSDLRVPGLKPKDLVMMPHRLAIALQDAGWWVRMDHVWAKKNPMPESVRDRCTKSHEYIFLLTKSAQYFYNADALAEPVSDSSVVRLAQDIGNQTGSSRVQGRIDQPMKAVQRGVAWGHGSDAEQRQRGRVKGIDAEASSCTVRGSGWRAPAQPPMRNMRSVWTFPTQGFSDAHFATFPIELPDR